MTLGLAVQPSVLSGLAGKQGFRGRGLLGRFAYSLPANNLGRRKIEPPPLAQEVGDTFKRNLQALLALPSNEDEQGQARTELLKLSPEATQRITAFQAWVEPQLADHGDLGIMTIGRKLVGLVSRIAGLLHMAKHTNSAMPWNIPIARETVECAIRIGEYLIPHARAAFACMGADPAVEDAKRVLAWVLRQELRKFSKRDAFNGLRGRFRKVVDLDPVLSALVDRNFIRPMDAEPSPGPGRKRSPEFEVNPQALKSNSAYCADSAEDGEVSNLGEESFGEDPQATSGQAAGGSDDGTHITHNTQNSPETNQVAANPSSPSKPLGSWPKSKKSRAGSHEPVQDREPDLRSLRPDLPGQGRQAAEPGPVMLSPVLWAAWWTKFEGRPVGVADLWIVAGELDEPLDLGEGSERSQKTRLGKLLGQLRDRRYEGRCVMSAGDRQRAKVWRLVGDGVNV